MEVKELCDLFGDYEVDGSMDKLSFPNDYHHTPIPICQHNIYKYSPLHISPSLSKAGSFQIVFPSSRLDHFTHLDDNVFLSAISESESKIKPRTREESGKQMSQVTFTPSVNFGIDDLMAQMYLSYVNQFNLENWYPLLREVEEEQGGTIKEEGKEEIGEKEGKGGGKEEGGGKEGKGGEEVKEGKREHKHPVFPATELIELLPHEIVNIESIYEKTSQGRYLGQASKEIREMAKEMEPRLQAALEKLHKKGKEGKEEEEGASPFSFFFFKLNTRSPKDSVYYKDKSVFASIDKTNTAPHHLKKCQATNAHEVISALVSSSRVHDDCKSYREWRVKESVKPPLLLVLQEWRTFNPEMEFRCFVFERQLTAIGQLCWEKHIPELDNALFKEQVLTSIETLFAAIKDKIPWENCIMDVIYDKEKDFSQICEFNPWGPYSCTGSQIHNWELDEDILFGEKHKVDGLSRPYFRTIKKGMLIVDHFDLYVPKVMCNFSATFLEKLHQIEGRCVCCVRKKRHEKVIPLPPKPHTKLVHLIQ